MASYDSTSDYAWLVPPLPTLPKSPLPPFSFPKLPSLILSPPFHFSSPPQSQCKRYNSANSFLTRKRPLGFRNLHRSSLNLSPYASSPPFPLPSDLLPLILSYLPPSTVRTLSLVSLSFHDLSSSPIYWYNLSLEKWELPRNICFVDKTSLDSFKKLGDGGEKKITKLGSTVDLKYLLTLSPQTLHPHSISSQFFRGSNAKFSRSPTDKNLIHFKGTTGIGDRCVTTSTPFPSSIKKLRNNTLKPLPKIIRALFRNYIEEEREPFVYPYCVQKGVYDISPRLFCYFEISILPSSSNINENQVPIEEREGERFNSVNGESDECVAVGLSYEGFDCESKMPGWDERSYGYHGDDGGGKNERMLGVRSETYYIFSNNRFASLVHSQFFTRTEI
ncbi:hypothetical protein TL16_g02782 [Triparma laevis f. inornata]|uniref:F-box domain-containing protein n=1 Tax=Triparma laevis f. inornata TaxID=1714386 RepID=A0A9W7DWP8_9STRA|nr:hypothetical protein TL16_g02782 [Triparma laevis f. inornata]